MTTDADIAALRQRLDETGTTLATKPDYRVWWHAAVAWVMRVVFAVLRAVGASDRHFEDFWTTLGSVVYAPAGQKPDLSDPYDYSVVCHELAHRYDDEAHGWWYRVSYVLSGRWRAYWEARGYGMQMIALYRRIGRVPQQWPERFASQISGPAYLWAGDEQKLRGFFIGLRQELKSGKLAADFYDPNRERLTSRLPEP